MEELALHTLKPKSRKRHRRVGRGNASGRGTYSGRGIKGQNARSGGGVRPGFEGGRMPLIRQLPKNRGFKSLQKKAQVVNLSQLEECFEANAKVTAIRLVKQGLITSASQRVKILGQGAVTKKLNVYADAFSKTAENGIKKAGGTIHLR